MTGTDTDTLSGTTSDGGTDPARAIDHIERRADEIRTEHVQRALRRLEAHGDLTDEQRAAVETLGERLVDRLVEPPRRSLRAGEEGDDAAATARALFSRGNGR